MRRDDETVIRNEEEEMEEEEGEEELGKCEECAKSNIHQTLTK